MDTRRRVIACLSAIVAFAIGGPAGASSIRDGAKMFHPDTVEKAEARLERIERAAGVPVVIETIRSIPGLTEDSKKDERERAINQLAERRDQEIRDQGIYILIARREHVISETLIREHLAEVLPLREASCNPRRVHQGLRQTGFRWRAHERSRGDRIGVEWCQDPERTAQAPVVGGRGARVRGAAGGASTMWTILLIGGGILAVFLILRLLGGLFGRSAGAGYPNQSGMGMPRPGMGPGGGPGYYGGGGGYGGRGGGFFSSLLGGLGGAMAGNWLYDQMSGHHGGSTAAGMGYGAEDPSSAVDRGDDAIIGADDDGGRGSFLGR